MSSRLAQLRELDRKGQLHSAVLSQQPESLAATAKIESQLKEPYREPEEAYHSERTRHNYGYDVLDRGKEKKPLSAANESDLRQAKTSR